MLDSSLSPTAETCDLVIVGAGLAGLNALASASKHLRRGQRVVLIDRRPRSGGMWNDTYDYVRLHQPHVTFTVGNQRWKLDVPREHLASKPEVLDHFATCLATLQRKVDVDLRFGWEYDSHTEASGKVRVECSAADGRRHSITTDRLIKASGFDVHQNPPLTLSSSQVHSVSPDSCDLRSGAIAESSAPVWVIGGGKTAMDTAHTLITAYPGREVNLIAGSGTLFQNRDLLFPTGVRRWTNRLTSNAISLGFARQFNGQNEDEVLRWFNQTCGLAVTDPALNYLGGIISEAETKRIDAGLTQRIRGRLSDVFDGPTGPEVHLANGDVLAARAGDYFVNCTGYLMRREVPYEPFTSASGQVLSINPRSQTMLLSSHAGHFLTHLLFRDQLAVLPLCELDSVALRAQRPAAMFPAVMSCNVHNLGVMFAALPITNFQFWRTDYDYWYAPPRRGIAQLDFMRHRKADIAHCRAALDVVHERFGIRAGLLTA